MSARSQQKRKEEKRKKRQQKMARRPTNGMSARNQLGKALAAVEQLKQLEGGLGQLGDMGVMVQTLLQEVTELRPLLDAVIEDNEALAQNQDTLLEAVLSLYDTVPGSSDEIRAKLAMLAQPPDEDAG